MDELFMGLMTFCICVVGLVGGCVYDNQSTKHKQLECIQLIHDKPSVEINAVCGRAINE